MYMLPHKCIAPAKQGTCLITCGQKHDTHLFSMMHVLALQQPQDLTYVAYT